MQDPDPATDDSGMTEAEALSSLQRWLDRRVRLLHLGFAVFLLVGAAGQAHGSADWQEALVSAILWLIVVGGAVGVGLSIFLGTPWKQFREVTAFAPARLVRLRERTRIDVVLADGTELTWPLRSRRRTRELREGIPLWVSRPLTHGEQVIAVTRTPGGRPRVLEPAGDAWPPSRWN